MLQKTPSKKVYEKGGCFYIKEPGKEAVSHFDWTSTQIGQLKVQKLNFICAKLLRTVASSEGKGFLFFEKKG